MLGFFLKLINFIPTKRPQDYSVQGEGVIVSLKGKILKAKNSKFLPLKEKDSISIASPKALLFVSKVIDAETIEVENPKGIEFEGKEESYKITPKIDHSKMFENCYKLLAENKVVGIFPEVSGHNCRAVRMIKPRCCRSKQE